ncbi:hypothetical protein [Spirosoma rigui]|uniref:hypothetical protein n=1 Tax=Spirosoma rigui TaxID=564064 RepID=UPI0012D35868|nr:hypothetical protein [Spirosoma rigui]
MISRTIKYGWDANTRKPIRSNAPRKHVATNQRAGELACLVYTVPAQNRHINYEHGLREGPECGTEHTPQ